jgi:hypothetical protein
LPEPIITDYSVEGSLPVVRTAMESGRARVHRVTDTIARNSGFSIALTVAQSAIFWNFFNDEANAGADWFYMPIDTANSVDVHLCRFTGYPSMKKIKADCYMVTVQIETDEQVIV